MGELLDRYRNDLYAVARTQIDVHLSVRASPSDVVQEVFLQATRQFPAFQGNSEAELLARLRRMLARTIVEKHKITGGTGRFAGATRNIAVNGTIVLPKGQ